MREEYIPHLMTANPPTSSPGAVEVREVDAARWPDFELLFESRGGPSYRFCGFVPVFAAHGFSEAGRAGLRRHVMRRLLG